MAEHTHASSALLFWPMALMWFGMMAAMMTPTVWPWVRAFHRFTGASSDENGVATVRFVSGYLVAWLGYAIVAALLQRALQRTALMPPSGDAMVPRIGAVILLFAGLYQFASLKSACLAHCRTPLGYFLTRWRNGPLGAFRMGLHHGLFCVGCCWALMATAFAVGVMNTVWMVLLGVVVFVEQTAPHGQTLRRLLGVALMAGGIWRLAVFPWRG
jgi:predicted metal-binding membrane protein